MCFLLLYLAFFVTHASSQDFEYVTECPEPDGLFADALQCDKYYKCSNNEVTEELCPDGLVFDESSVNFPKCSFPFSIDCDGRSELQEAKPSPGCPRQNGYFPDSEFCEVFYFCVDGHPNKITCPSGLIFDAGLGQCGWADQSTRKGCTPRDLFDFSCPNFDPGNKEHSRYADPNDCAYFYLCIDGNARRNRCGEGLVFDGSTLSCERQETVSGVCGSWYNQTYLDSIFAPKTERNREREPTTVNRKRLPPVRNDFRKTPAITLEQENKFQQENLPDELRDLIQNVNLGEKRTQVRPRNNQRNNIRKTLTRPQKRIREESQFNPDDQAFGRRRKVKQRRRPQSTLSRLTEVSGRNQNGAFET